MKNTKEMNQKMFFTQQFEIPPGLRSNIWKFIKKLTGGGTT